MTQIEDNRTRAATAWGFRRGLRNTGLAAAALIWLAAMIFGGPGFGLDERLHDALYITGDPALSRNAALLTKLGSWVVLVPVAIAAATFLAFTRRMRAALLLIIVFGGRLLVELQKLVVDRPRPGVSPYLEAVHSMSFPSGHSANAMLTYVGIALLLPVRQRMRAVLVGLGLAVALQVGWSRVAIGVHWSSDVVGGWSFGLLWIAVCMRLASDRPEGDAVPASR